MIDLHCIKSTFVCLRTRAFDGADEICAPAELLPHESHDDVVLVKADRAEVLQRVRHHLESERAADAVAYTFSVT